MQTYWTKGKNKIRWETQITEFNTEEYRNFKRIGSNLFNRYIDYYDKKRF